MSSYYHTPWQTEEEISLAIQGLDMDTVYENFVRQIAGDTLKAENGESLQEKQIEKLTKAVRREKQFNKQMELNKELKKLKKQLEDL